MDYFKINENVEQYLEMTADYDASFIVNKILTVLPQGSSLLELGMGPGKDLEELAKYYQVTGSDYSDIFVKKFNERQTKLHAIVLDAIKMNTDLMFDCIYSNKVLHHLSREDFKVSLRNQHRHLTKDGIIFMTLWRGEYKEEVMFDGTFRFSYYLEEDIEDLVADNYDIISMETYEEFEPNDSLIIVLKMR